MENAETNEYTEEIVIVGSKYGKLADVLNPIYEKGEPIEKEKFVNLIGGEEVYLNPRDNKYDAFAVGVYTAKQKLLGYVWMQQAPSVHRWMAEKGKRFVAAKIERFNTQTGLIMAKPKLPMKLERVTRSEGIDMDWAKELPLVITDIKQQGLEMGLFVLTEKLEELTEWDDSLKPMLDNVFRYLETDLSDYCYRDCIDVYKAMRNSPIAVVREKGDWFLKALVNRGSKERIMWWIDKWLPNFMKEAMGSDLLGVYEKSGYTLEMVEKLLNDAPMHLYQMYHVNKYRFAKQLYYSALPPQIYYRLLTLLTLRKAMKEEARRIQMEDERCDVIVPMAERGSKEYWLKLKKHGFVDKNCQLMPETTRKQAMYIAEAFAEKMKIKSKWKTFESLWHISNLAQEKWEMQQTGVFPSDYEVIDTIFT